ncbi:unnamed protein product [Protopolystoma xenopodis]|uniref:Uncharacterized protein n=1 Tax=Protopolystoma xenopodis TaxID=117903 RepID=A0A3S5BK04_9PLAT|nr:unnamed protein product [Protopolystoma xenopodis]
MNPYSGYNSRSRLEQVPASCLEEHHSVLIDASTQFQTSSPSSLKDCETNLGSQVTSENSTSPVDDHNQIAFASHLKGTDKLTGLVPNHQSLESAETCNPSLTPLLTMQNPG